MSPSAHRREKLAAALKRNVTRRKEASGHAPEAAARTAAPPATGRLSGPAATREADAPPLPPGQRAS